MDNGGGGCKIIFESNSTVALRLRWGFDNFSIIIIIVYFVQSIGTIYENYMILDFSHVWTKMIKLGALS